MVKKQTRDDPRLDITSNIIFIAHSSSTLSGAPKYSTTTSTQIDSNTAMRRKQFATRRESSIGAMVMTNKFEDNDIRRKFRNYEI